MASGTAERLREIRFVGLVAEIAFFVAVGLAPLAVATLALLGGLEPLLPPEAATRIDGIFIGAVMQVFGGDVSADAFADTQRLLDSGLRGLIVPVVIGVVFSARGFTGAMRGLGHLYGHETARPLWRDALATVAFTLGAAVLGAISALGALLAPVGETGSFIDALSWVRWLVIPAGLVVWLTSLYSYSRGPDSGRWITEVPGAVVATVAIVGAGLLFGLHLRRTPTLGLGPFIGAVVGVALSLFSLLFAYAAAIVAGGAFNAEREGEQTERGGL